MLRGKKESQISIRRGRILEIRKIKRLTRFRKLIVETLIVFLIINHNIAGKCATDC